MRFRKFLGLGILAVSLMVIVWTSIPQKTNHEQIPITLTDGRIGLLTITSPAFIRAGDNEEITLSIAMDNQGGTPPALDPIGFSSRFEIGGILRQPIGDVHIVFSGQGSALFNWQLQTDVAAEHHGNLWVFIEEPGGEKQLVLGREITLNSHRFCGMSYPAARVAAICLILIGGLLFIPTLHFPSKKSSES